MSAVGACATGKHFVRGRGTVFWRLLAFCTCQAGKYTTNFTTMAMPLQPLFFVDVDVVTLLRGVMGARDDNEPWLEMGWCLQMVAFELR